jgi:hypothetical protein
MSRAERIPPSEWEKNKEHIRALYLDQDKSLDDLVIWMAEQHCFHASYVFVLPLYTSLLISNYSVEGPSTSENWEPGT